MNQYETQLYTVPLLMGQVLLVGQTVTSQSPSLQIHTHTREIRIAQQYKLHDSSTHILKGLPIQLQGQTWDLEASELHEHAAFKLACPKN